MRTMLTVQELLKGRNAGFDSVANEENKIQMTCLPLNTMQGKNGVDFGSKNVSKFPEFLEKAGKKDLMVFLSTWSVSSSRDGKRAERMTKADYIVFFWAYDHQSNDAEKPSKLLGVFKVKNHTINTNSRGDYLLDIEEVSDFSNLSYKIIVDWGLGQEMTQDYFTNPKYVI